MKIVQEKKILSTLSDLIRKKLFKKALGVANTFLRDNPNSYQVINLCGVIYVQLGEFDKSIVEFKRVINKNPYYPRAYNNLAFVIRRKGIIKEASNILYKGLQNNPEDNSLRYYLAVCLLEEGDLLSAKRLLWECINRDPSDWEAKYKLGNLYEKMKKYDLAISMYKKVTRHKKHPPIVEIKIADLYKNSGNKKSAEMFYQYALNDNQTNSKLRQHIATKLFELENYEVATNLFERLLNEKFENEGIYINLSNIYLNSERLDDSIILLKRAKEKYPSNEIISFNLGNLYKSKGKFLEAINEFKVAINTKSDFFQAYSNLGVTYNNIGKYSKGIKFLNHSLSINKKNNTSRSSSLTNIGIAKLTLGKFKEGWEKYEYRWKVDPGDKVVWPLKDRPLWDGTGGKRVLLWREQGIGDDIIFLGLVSEAYEAAGQPMSVLIDPRLVTICERSMPGIEFLPALRQPVKEDSFDCHLPMGSLPRLFRSAEEDFSRTREGYLKADMTRVETLRKELGIEDKKVIGISWKSFKSLNTTKKSMDLDRFGRMFQDCNVALLNLQYGDVDEEIREFEKSTGIHILQSASVDLREDLDGLAALIELCDLVVSTSNITIHMAGALGKDSWVLLPFAANCWWLIDRSDSLWYPTVKLYRQKSLQDWSAILEVVRSDLDQRFDKR